MIRLLSFGIVAALLGFSGSVSASQDGRELLDGEELSRVLAAPLREADRPRDKYRHPKATLEFFEVMPDHIIIEYAPGGGWYTRILAPFVAEKGRYIAVNLPAEGDVPERFKQRLGEWPRTFPGQVAEWTGLPAESVAAHLGGALPDALDGTVDRVLIFRMMHNLFRWNVADSELKALRAALKPDRLLGIVQHRAGPDAPFSYADGNHGYLREEDLIKFVEAHGFELVAKSELNANPKDTADHERGVWALPPSYRGGDEEREKYAAIGESDRMTLLFRKAK